MDVDTLTPSRRFLPKACLIGTKGKTPCVRFLGLPLTTLSQPSDTGNLAFSLIKQGVRPGVKLTIIPGDRPQIGMMAARRVPPVKGLEASMFSTLYCLCTSWLYCNEH